MRVVKYLVMAFMLTLVFNCSAMACFMPSVKVMISEQEGKAKLAEAESSRQIVVLEAKAKLESAEMLGKAEITRAKATAEANKILGDSLKNNQAYLRYLWIEKISEQPNIIYVPTEAGLPVLEAGKR